MTFSFTYISQISFIIVLLIVSFLTGFFFSQREIFIQNTKPSIELTHASGAKYTLFSDMKTKPIYGLFTGNKAIVGTFQYLIDDDNQTTYFILSFNTRLSKEVLESIPNTYQILFARVCCNGLDYEYDNSQYVVEAQKNTTTISGNFTSSINTNIENVIDRILITNDEGPNEFQIIKDEEKDWPKNTTEQNAPYMWINM